MELLEDYRRRYAPGYPIEEWLPEIVQVVSDTGARTILDYGCGNARQYYAEKFYAAWSDTKPRLYEPGRPPFASPPQGTFDGVICTGYLDRIPEGELARVCKELHTYALKFLFVTVSGARLERARQALEGRVKPGCRLELREVKVGLR